MNNTKLSPSTQQRTFVFGVILLFSCCLFIFTDFRFNHFHINFSFHRIKFFSSFTISTTTTTTTSTIDINEVLCNNQSNSSFNITLHPCEKIRCIVLIQYCAGRLGNRMFLFASAYGLARTHGCRLFIAPAIRSELLQNFQMSIEENLLATKEDTRRLQNVRNIMTQCDFFPELLRPNAFRYLELRGYWQSYLYFDAYREEIRQLYTARNMTLVKLVKYFSNLTNNDCPECSFSSIKSHSELRQILRNNLQILYIGIHIRARDFRGLRLTSDDSYIFRAMSYYKRRFYKHKIRFLIATDEKPHYQKIFSNKQTFILPFDFTPIDDLIAISLCHHTVITSGSFGFWTAYLSGGEVIHDNKYQLGCSRLEYYPSWLN